MNSRSLIIPLFICSVVLAGCLETEEYVDGKVVVKFASLGNPQEVETINESIAAFEEKHPDIHVKFIHAVENYDQLLLTMMATNRGPDVFTISPPFLPGYISRGLLMNIQKRIETSDQIVLDEIFPQTLEPYRFDGKKFGVGDLYGLTKDWSPDRVIFYNKTLFDEAGIPHPDGSWTRAEFVEIAKKLTKRDDQGRTIQFGVYNNCEPQQWVRQSGGSFFSADGRRCTLDTPAAKAGLQFAADLSLKHRVAPNIAEAQQAADYVMFETGRVAMCFYGMWFVPEFKKRIKEFEWGVVTPPRDENDVYLSLGMVGYAMNARSKNPDEAWLFFEHMAGRWGQMHRANLGWNLPSNQMVANGEQFRENPDLDRTIIDVFLDAVPKTEFVGLNPYIEPEEFNLYFSPQWDMVLLGDKSVEDAVERIVRDVNRAIEDNIALKGGAGI
jgi:multiple sugar transport system substrate-binding protein